MGGYSCPVCRETLCWESDEDAEDVGYYEKGIVSYLHCENCGVHIEMFIPETNIYKGEKNNGIVQGC